MQFYFFNPARYFSQYCTYKINRNLLEPIFIETLILNVKEPEPNPKMTVFLIYKFYSEIEMIEVPPCLFYDHIYIINILL